MIHEMLKMQYIIQILVLLGLGPGYLSGLIGSWDFFHLAPYYLEVNSRETAQLHKSEIVPQKSKFHNHNSSSPNASIFERIKKSSNGGIRGIRTILQSVPIVLRMVRRSSAIHLQRHTEFMWSSRTRDRHDDMSDSIILRAWNSIEGLFYRHVLLIIRLVVWCRFRSARK